MAPLDDEDNRVLDHLINGGFLAADEIKTTFMDEFLDGVVTDADRAAIGEEIDRRVTAAEERQRKWTGPTTYDRLERAFADIRDKAGSTAYAQQAGLLAAKVLFEQKQPERAKAALEWVAQQAADDPGLRAVARLRLAALLADAKAYDAALAQLGVLLIQPTKLDDDLVQEVIDLVLVVALAELGRLETLVDDVFRGQSHGICLSS